MEENFSKLSQRVDMLVKHVIDPGENVENPSALRINSWGMKNNS